MKRLKEFNYFVEKGNILIRSIRNNDLLFYEHWNIPMTVCCESFFNIPKTVGDDSFNIPLIMELVYTEKGFTLLNKKSYQILIIEINEEVIGDITIRYDKDLLLKDKSAKKPYYIIEIELHKAYSNTDINNKDINNLIKLFIDSIDKFKLKIGTLCVFKDEYQNFENNYIENGFSDIKWGYDYKRLSNLVLQRDIFQHEMLIKKM